MRIVDVNAAFGSWPIQRFSSQTLEDLDQSFEKAGIEDVWLSAVESILYPEPDTWDLQLFERLEVFPRFRPVKTVNPLLTNWQQSWETAEGNFPLAAIKLFPNYHHYSLEAATVGAICQRAATTRTPVLIQMRVNDERNQPHSLQMAGVSATEIVALSQRHPDTLLVALSSTGRDLSTLAQGGNNLFTDISFLDGSSLLRRAMDLFPKERLVFGSCEAFLYAEASRRKLRYSRLPENVVQDIASDNISAAGKNYTF